MRMKLWACILALVLYLALGKRQRQRKALIEETELHEDSLFSRACPFGGLGFDDEPEDLHELNVRIGATLIKSQRYQEAIECYRWAVVQDRITTGVKDVMTNNLNLLSTFLNKDGNTIITKADTTEKEPTKEEIAKDRAESKKIKALFPEVYETKCPFEELDIEGNDENEYDPIEVTNRAAELLFRVGRLEAALHCFKWSLRNVPVGTPASTKEALQVNVRTVKAMLIPGGKTSRRILHQNGGNPYPLDSEPLPRQRSNRTDPFLQVWDGAFSEEQCQTIIDIFESSAHYVGNVIRDGKVVVDHSGKKASEFDISSTAVTNATWAAVEGALMAALTKHLMLYEEANPVMRTLVSPLGDEGFRMKRYFDDGTEHHAYHVDSGSEIDCKPRRVLAILLYMNDVEEGGETVFLQQGRVVKPRCGRVAIFPTSFTYIHSGRRPVSNTKYNIINFITD